MPFQIIYVPSFARPIPSLPGYHADAEGNIYRETNMGCLWLTTTLSRRGYFVVSVTEAGRKRVRPVHQLVLEAFVGPRPAGFQCCHNDGNRTNNRLDNLRYDSVSANQLDRDKHGTSNVGDQNGQAKLRASDVAEIRRMVASGFTTGEIARHFCVSPATISDIKAGRTWGKVNTAVA